MGSINVPYAIRFDNKESFENETAKEIKEKSKTLARKKLGIYTWHENLSDLENDIKAHLATMAVADYDTVVKYLQDQINIDDYFTSSI